MNLRCHLTHEASAPNIEDSLRAIWQAMVALQARETLAVWN